MSEESALELYITSFQSLRKLTDKVFKQLKDEDYHYIPSPESNSMAIIMKHIAGNMLSRWTDFLTSDGEKPGRNRDSEFVDEYDNVQHPADKNDLFDFWNKGWDRLFSTLSELEDDDLEKIVYIRNESHTVLKAILRAYSHYSYHIGQLVYIAKMINDENWV